MKIIFLFVKLFIALAVAAMLLMNIAFYFKAKEAREALGNYGAAVSTSS